MNHKQKSIKFRPFMPNYANPLIAVTMGAPLLLPDDCSLITRSPFAWRAGFRRCGGVLRVGAVADWVNIFPCISMKFCMRSSMLLVTDCGFRVPVHVHGHALFRVCRAVCGIRKEGQGSKSIWCFQLVLSLDYSCSTTVK